MAVWHLSGVVAILSAGIAPNQTAIVVRGADGSAEYAEVFDEAVRNWRQACDRGGVACRVVGVESDSEIEDRQRLYQLLDDEPATGPTLWIAFIGHGTYDGRTAKFNLRGPDVSTHNLAERLARFRRPLAIVNCASSSGPFLNALSGPNRAVITATRSGSEQNYTRFNEYFAASLTDPQADLDKDGQVSLLEAFLAASNKTAEFYEQQGRLATEHALLDDNGDGLGTPADWFRGLQAIKRAREDAELDGRRAHQIHLIPSEIERRIPPELRDRRDSLELEIFSLRDRKSSFNEDEYFGRLEALLTDFIAICDEIETLVDKGE